MTTIEARYDGHADWYDAYNEAAARSNAAELAALLGSGDGLCLDIGCGTGQYFDTIRSTGRTPIGVDFSTDQLRVAARRNPALARADAARLPFADSVFPTVVMMWLSTDVDDFRVVVADAARVLAPDGLFVFHGVHPCFNGPAVQAREDGGLIVHPTYRRSGWYDSAPWWKQGIRRRTGMRHLSLAELLNAFLGVGLVLDRVAEPGQHAVPSAIAIRARAAR
jgi:SAM-dependent methyltransferase